MFNKKFISLICLFLFSNTIYGINMKKDEVLNIDVLKFTNPKECPEYSNDYDYTNGHCTFRFFCKGDDCSSVDKKGYVQFNSNGQTKNLNTNICITGNDSNGPFCFNNQPACKTNADCFTNNCLNSTCVINKDAPTIECLDEYYYRSLTFSYVGKMRCGLGQYEPCKKNDDCASKSCGDGIHGDICVNARWDRTNDRKNDIITKLLILISIIIAIIGSCIFHKKATKDKKKEMENINKV
ncbi:hypothetical protein H8356DRAFT_1668768 [Neocallimastix lanati (nom. inval.)]|nr:hypothetical protein H8356DRAFT_1668768 [Neocallimastix sp. JGI-2020a]